MQVRLGIPGARAFRGHTPNMGRRGVGNLVALGVLAAFGYLAIAVAWHSGLAILGNARSAGDVIADFGPLGAVSLACAPAALAIWFAYDRNSYRLRARNRWRPVALTALAALACLTAVEVRNGLFSTAASQVIAGIR